MKNSDGLKHFFVNLVVSKKLKFQQTPGIPDMKSPPVYEGNPFIFVFWGTWCSRGMLEFS